MCNENENAQMRPVCEAKMYADIAEQKKQDWGTKCLTALSMRSQEIPKSERICRLADENIELSRNIVRLEKFLKNRPERFASAKQVKLMQGQLKAMENYKFFLSCRIADLALSDLEQSEEKIGRENG